MTQSTISAWPARGPGATRWWLTLTCVWCVYATSADATEALRLRALSTIKAPDAKRHVDVLADDAFEGREAGTRGGRAAAGYLADHLKKAGLRPAGDRGSYYQTFHGSSRNVLALLSGTEEGLSDELIICGAHYDHVGYGRWENSRGPIGRVHNGADDNASGVAAVLEILDAFAETGHQPARSVLFAFWDGEEKGLLGSRHWQANRTVTDKTPVAVINMDMVGRLTDSTVHVYGSRTAFGWRKRLAYCLPHQTDVRLKFVWKLENNSDHFPFVERRIPAIMFHTGLHDDYHTPRDDADRINVPGIASISRLAFNVLEQLANADNAPQFRPQARSESDYDRGKLERTTNNPPARLGLSWKTDSTDVPKLVVTNVTHGTPAYKAGIRPGDTLLAFDGQPLLNSRQLHRVIQRSPGPCKIEWKRGDQSLDRELELAGHPTRLGISWRRDAAEPDSVIVTRVVYASPAHDAGIRIGDRIYRFGDESIGDDQWIGAEVRQADVLPCEVERDGRIRHLELHFETPDASAPVVDRNESALSNNV